MHETTISTPESRRAAGSREFGDVRNDAPNYKGPYTVVKAGPIGNLWAVEDADGREVDAFDGSEKAKAQAKCDKLNAQASNANPEQIRAIEAMLSNDEASTDQQLVQHIVQEMKIPEAEAKAWVAKRAEYLNSSNAGPITAEVRAARGKAAYGSAVNSYGNFSIEEDIQRGMTKDQIIQKIQSRYSDIGFEQAKRIVEAVQKSGAGASTDWGHYGSEK